MSQFSFKPFPGDDAVTVTKAVTRYETRYRRSDVPPLEFAGPLDLFPSQAVPAGVTPESTWKQPWPFIDRAGVYLVYSVSLKLLYVGTAQHLGARLSQHFIGNGEEECIIREKWNQQPRFVFNIAVPRDMPFEASGLEAFLIGELQPLENVKGK
ncbi:MAG: GIY-YIG nuclease family protein [Verrucomicrobiia bacterium]